MLLHSGIFSTLFSLNICKTQTIKFSLKRLVFLHFVKIQCGIVSFGCGVCVHVCRICFLMQQTNKWEPTDKLALIYVENRFELLLFNSDNLVVNPVLLGPIYKSHMEKEHLHRYL